MGALGFRLFDPKTLNPNMSGHSRKAKEFKHNWRFDSRLGGPRPLEVALSGGE